MSDERKGQLSLFEEVRVDYAPLPTGITEPFEQLVKLLENEEFREAAKLMKGLFAAGQHGPVIKAFFAKADYIAQLQTEGFQNRDREPHVQVELIEELYVTAKALPERWMIAAFLDDAKRFRKRLLDAWQSGDVDEAALLYGVAYGHPYNDESGGDGLSAGVDAAPTEMLRQLLTYPWPAHPHLKGIKSWLQEEIEEREA